MTKRKREAERKSIVLRSFHDRQALLSEVLAPFFQNFSTQEQGAIVADLIDLYDISIACIDQINLITRQNANLTADELEDALIRLQIETLVHLPFHQKSLRTVLKKILKNLESHD